MSNKGDVDSDITSKTDDFFLGKDKITKWMKLPLTSETTKATIVTDISGTNSTAKDVKSIYEAFALFFDDSVIALLVENTNIYIETKVVPNVTRSRDAKLVTTEEMKAFIGLLIVAGVMHSSHQNYEDLFTNDDFAGEFFYKTMCYQRFLFIFRCIRFDDIRSHEERLVFDQLAPIRSLFDNLVSKFQKFFSPSEYITIGEQYMAFQGPCTFRQNIPSNRNRPGIKLFVMADAKNFYTINMEVYLGTQPEGPYNVSNSLEEIVVRLVKPVDNSGRNITMDNLYISIPLANRLLSHHNLTVVGTLRKNEKEIPPEFFPNKSHAVKSTTFGFTETATLLSYTSAKTKVILLLSTMHHDNAIDIESGNEKQPEMLSFYNMTKQGVNTADKLCATYNATRRSKRWPLKLFFHLINVCALNAYIIYNHNNPNTRMERQDFLKLLGKELVSVYQTNRSEYPQLPRKLRKLLGEPSQPKQEVEVEVTKGSRKRCYICPRSRNRYCKQICLHCKKNICSEHTKNLCNQTSESECLEVFRKRRKLLDECTQPGQEEEIEVMIGTRKRCHICSRSKNRYSKQICLHCKNNICSEHTKSFCTECYNVYVTCSYNNPNTRMQRPDFPKALELVNVDQASQSECPQLPRKEKDLLGKCNQPKQEMEITTGSRKRCYLCPRSRNRHTKQICLHCKKNICSEHTISLCNQTGGAECLEVPRKKRKLLGECSQPGQEGEIEAMLRTRKRCHICPRSKNRYSKQICLHCEKNICSEHTKNLCIECYNI